MAAIRFAIQRMGKNAKTFIFFGGCNFRKDKNLGFCRPTVRDREVGDSNSTRSTVSLYIESSIYGRPEDRNGHESFTVGNKYELGCYSVVFGVSLQRRTVAK